MKNRPKFLIAAALIALAGAFSPSSITAQGAAPQEPGKITGRVIDQLTGEGLSGVVITVQPSGRSSLSGVDGRFVVSGVPPGTVSVKAQNLGFADKTVTEVTVTSGGVVEVNISLNTTAIEVAGLTVTAAAERGSVTRALDQQRTAKNIVSAITSEQIARSPDGDAAAAMQRVSGVTVQEGKFIFVRGVGERYTTTSLNGARIPSPEPERKVVPLDLFPAGLLQSITTSKTFTPDQPGDFAGAQVNIETREFPADRQLTFSLGGGYNSRTTGKTLPAAPTVGPEWLGFSGSERLLPSLVEQAGKFTTPFSQPELNRIVGSFRNAWSADSRSGRPNSSLGLSMGGTDPVLGRDLSYLASFSYSRSQEVRANQIRAQAQATGQGGIEEINRFVGTTGSTGVLWGGLLQVSSLLGQKTRLVLNSTYNRTADNEARVESGFSEQFAVPLDITRLRFVERNVFSGQLRGDHELARRHRLDWAGTISSVARNEPDRSEFVYFRPTDPTSGGLLPPEWLSGSNEGAVRTFGDLNEQSFEGSANYSVDFGPESQAHAFKFGGLFRQAERDASNRSYAIFGTLAATERRLTPEEIFDGRNTEDGDAIMRVTPLFQGGSYTADDQLLASYGMLDFALSRRIRLVAGARLERSKIRVDAEPTIGASVSTDTTYNDLLPAASLNVNLTENMNLRLSASRTLARPEYRELADISYRDVIGSENVRGNPDLVRTRIWNADIRWEWYPSSGEVVSVALFGKDFENPIERVLLTTSGTSVATFVNAEGASNYGVELEVRKRLGTLFSSLEPWTIFANTTLMKSDIQIPEGITSATNSERAMVGQAPYVVNAGLTYATRSGSRSATVLYNVVGKRVFSAAEVPLPDVYDMPRNVLDLSLRVGLTNTVSAKLDVRNMLDEAFEQRQGTIVREYYNVGRSFAVGMSWRN